MNNMRNILGVLAVLGCGYLLGQLVRAEAQAAPKAYTECLAAQVNPATLRDLAKKELPASTKLPAGWTPVGGTSSNNYAMVVICR